MSTFAFTDIHGCKRLYDAIIKYCMESDPNCTIVFTGDACDRGQDGYAIMKDLLSRKNVIYLKGNHEDMFVKAAKSYMLNRQYIFEEHRTTIKKRLLSMSHYDTDIELYLYNGGYSTIKDWIEDGCDLIFVNKIEELPLTYSMNQFDFCHAGGLFSAFQRIKGSERPNKYDVKNILWDRKEFDCAWQDERIVVHGHTPVSHMPQRYSKIESTEEPMNRRPVLYSGKKDKQLHGYKLNLDMGTFNSGIIYVFNCEKKEAIGFYDDKIINENSDKEIQNICKYKVEA